MDYSCGIGRHSIHLANLGYEVVGYDPSPFYIEIAKKNANKFLGSKNKIRFYQGAPTQVSKLLSQKKDTSFDAVVFMSSSLGFISEEYDVKMLKNVYSLSNNGSVLVIEFENRDHTLKNFRSQINYDIKNLHVYERWRFDYEVSKAIGECKYYEKQHDNSLKYLVEIETTLRLYSLHELKKLINSTGWKYMECCGNIMTIDRPNLDYEDIVTISKK